MRWTHDLRTDFDRNGFVLWRGALDATTVAALQTRFDRVVDDLAQRWVASGTIAEIPPGDTAGARYAAMRAAAPARFPIAWRRILVSPEVHATWTLPELLTAAHDLIAGPIRAHGIWNGRPREPDNDVQKIGWHQDAHYERSFDPEAPPVISMWIPLVEVTTARAALQFLPGSHRTGIHPFEPSPAGASVLLEIPADALPDIEPVTLECSPGDVIVFDNRVCHRALPNSESGFTRFSLDIRFGPDDEHQRGQDPRGFRLDPIEPYEVWAQRHGYSDEELRVDLGYPADLAATPSADLAAALGVDVTDLGVF